MSDEDPTAFELHGDAILKAVQDGASIRTASGIVGVPYQHVSRWLVFGAKNPRGQHGKFTRALRKAQAEQIREAELDHRDARKGNANAIQWWLSRMDPKTYGETPTQDDEVEDLPDATPDDIAKALGR